MMYAGSENVLQHFWGGVTSPNAASFLNRRKPPQSTLSDRWRCTRCWCPHKRQACLKQNMPPNQFGSGRQKCQSTVKIKKGCLKSERTIFNLLMGV